MQVSVTATQGLPDFRRTLPMCRLAPADKAKPKTTVVIVGGGAGGLVAAETLRLEGYDQRLVIVSADDRAPYDRTKLSKNLSIDHKTIPLRPPAFYEQHDIELVLNTRVTKFDGKNKALQLSSGASLQYDVVILAPGSVARILHSKGVELPGIFTVRSASDCTLITKHIERIPVKHAIVVGAGWIGMEAAAWLRNTAKVDVTVLLSPGTVPLERVLGTRIGRALQTLYENIGIKFVNESPAQFEGKDDVESVTTDKGTVIPTQLVIIGVGAIPATGFLKDSGVELAVDGGVVVDEYFRANGLGADVYAIGDIAHFPLAIAGGSLVRIEHWNVAQQHGRIAAKNVVGKKEAFRNVPFFWSMLSGKGLRYTGYSGKFDDKEIVLDGDVDKLTFVAFIINQQGTVGAVATMGRDPAATAAMRLFGRGHGLPSVAELQAGDRDLIKRLANDKE